jgi:hypothetical protein
MRIGSDGNVGIGTTTPEYPVTVANATQAIISGDTFNSTAGNRSILLLRRARGTQASPTVVSNGDTIGSVAANAYQGLGYASVAGINFEVDGAVTSGQRPPGRIVFATAVANSSVFERMRITTSGNVGIGRTDPPEKLSVFNSADSGTSIEVSNTNTGTGAFSRFIARSDGGAMNFFALGSNYTTSNQYIADSGLFEGSLMSNGIGFSTTVDAPIRFWQSGSEKMRINTGGNVGIGTTSPSAQLHTISTTEQLRVGYDDSNYFNATVGSTGTTTFNAVGSGAKFVFSDNVELTQTVTTEAVTSDTTVTIVINGTTYKLLATAV